MELLPAFFPQDSAARSDFLKIYLWVCLFERERENACLLFADLLLKRAPPVRSVWPEQGARESILISQWMISLSNLVIICCSSGLAGRWREREAARTQTGTHI